MVQTLHSTVQEKFIKVERLLAFTPQLNVKWGTWHHQATSISRPQRKYCTKYAESSLAWNAILRRAQNFQIHGRVGNEQDPERPAATCGQEQRIFNYFIWYPSSSRRRTDQDLRIAPNAIHDILRSKLHIAPNTLQILQQLEDHDSTCRNDIVKLCFRNTKFDALFMNHLLYCDECVFHVNGNVNKRNVRI